MSLPSEIFGLIDECVHRSILLMLSKFPEQISFTRVRPNLFFSRFELPENADSFVLNRWMHRDHVKGLKSTAVTDSCFIIESN
jgi:hypothetical protein